MNKRKHIRCSAILMLLLAVGCTDQLPPAIEATSTATTPDPPTVILESTSTATTTLPLVQATILPQTGIAPSFQEIASTIYKVTKRDVQPEGPEYDLHEIADPEIRVQFNNYALFLVGKRAENWQGWMSAIQEADLDNPAAGFDITAQMDPPASEILPFGNVYLEDVPYSDVAEILSISELQDHHFVLKKPLLRIMFSGTITGIGVNGMVNMHGNSLELINNTSP